MSAVSTDGKKNVPVVGCITLFFTMNNLPMLSVGLTKENPSSTLSTTPISLLGSAAPLKVSLPSLVSSYLAILLL